MKQFTQWLTRGGDKMGSLGALVSAMGCAMCFPAIASLGAAVGLAFLARWEGLFINTLLPFFAWLVLIMNAVGWFSHRQWHRSVLGMVGPTLLLLSLYPWFRYAWSTEITYTALGMMAAVSVWDLVSPANRRCARDGNAISSNPR
ncbi:organomercurial transporter MerC [Chromatocurvus halotolerans]|uniref:Mercuric ion transport protein n=1 Tax=Chromatocurvus halotolerans TaxID=1132028 RepID=A0A4R2KXS6_9GAMM|nr:organomercurial transporter MerC [Chromatocurvus halotolerans]TCO77882.1 mercuric ion transport protein [Chromatocurvus halotolerans]